MPAAVHGVGGVSAHGAMLRLTWGTGSPLVGPGRLSTRQSGTAPVARATSTTGVRSTAGAFRRSHDGAVCSCTEQHRRLRGGASSRRSGAGEEASSGARALQSEFVGEGLAEWSVDTRVRMAGRSAAAPPGQRSHHAARQRVRAVRHHDSGGSRCRHAKPFLPERRTLRCLVARELGGVIRGVARAQRRRAERGAMGTRFGDRWRSSHHAGRRSSEGQSVMRSAALRLSWMSGQAGRHQKFAPRRPLEFDPLGAFAVQVKARCGIWTSGRRDVRGDPCVVDCRGVWRVAKSRPHWTRRPWPSRREGPAVGGEAKSPAWTRPRRAGGGWWGGLGASPSRGGG